SRRGGGADGSCMLVVATDAPMDARDLRRLAARAVFGLARTGSAYSNGSGDFAIAFSTSADMRTRFGETAPRSRQALPTDGTSPLFEAALEATEEAVYNSLLQATAVRSARGTAEGIPADRLRDLLKRYRAATISRILPATVPGRQIPLEAVRDAARAIYEAAVRTPLVRVPLDGPAPDLYLKLEVLQPIGSFKIRGAYNAVR